MNTEIALKIKVYLKETIQDCEENQHEIDSEHRPPCEDGSDESIKFLKEFCENLLFKIKQWEKS
tara:strand:- start:297 stop:488 length:192 start_codon:yes stop_codon:yes gene_type:complete